MKRKYKEIQQVLDSDLYVAIQNGVTNPESQKAHIRQCLSERLTMTGEITVPYLLDVLAQVETSNSKQRLRLQGLIEITKDNETKLMDDISQDDAEYIFTRRARQLYGRVKSNFDFASRFGLEAQANESEQQLELFAPEEITADEITDEVDSPLNAT